MINTLKHYGRPLLQDMNLALQVVLNCPESQLGVDNIESESGEEGTSAGQNSEEIVSDSTDNTDRDGQERLQQLSKIPHSKIT
jgi:hypothetical protein